MKNRYIVITIIILLLVVGSVFLVTLLIKQQKNQTAANTSKPVGSTSITGITPNTVQNNKKIIKDSSLKDGAQNVSVTTDTLKVTTNTSVKQADVKIVIEPPTLLGYVVNDGKIIIKFLEKLKEGTVYSYGITVGNNPTEYGSFKTAGIGPTAMPTIEPPGFYEKQDEFDKKNNPDIFLSNKTPYETDSFVISSELKNTTPSHYAFTVRSKSSTNAKDAVETWMKSLGITSDQISTLDISYE